MLHCAHDSSMTTVPTIRDVPTWADERAARTIKLKARSGWTECSAVFVGERQWRGYTFDKVASKESRAGSMHNRDSDSTIPSLIESDHGARQRLAGAWREKESGFRVEGESEVQRQPIGQNANQ